MLSKANNFEGVVLAEALRETFERRNTGFEKAPTVFSESFKEDRDKKLQWNAKGKKIPLRFNKSGLPNIEKAYTTHYVRASEGECTYNE